jgi:hypothetical protein
MLPPTCWSDDWLRSKCRGPERVLLWSLDAHRQRPSHGGFLTCNEYRHRFNVIERTYCRITLASIATDEVPPHGDDCLEV